MMSSHIYKKKTFFYSLSGSIKLSSQFCSLNNDFLKKNNNKSEHCQIIHDFCNLHERNLIISLASCSLITLNYL